MDKTFIDQDYLAKGKPQSIREYPCTLLHKKCKQTKIFQEIIQTLTIDLHY